ncbi:MAG: hypothetical protein ACKO23_12110 [Gemmataceae bacterium]
MDSPSSIPLAAMKRIIAILVLALTGTAWAQGPGFPGPLPTGLPGSGPAPLTFVRFQGPPGMLTTFYQGRAIPRTYEAPTVVGLRPGYLYRMQLSRLPDRPNFAIFPTLEVRGSLKLKSAFGANQFPITVNLSEEDIQAAAAGTLVSKVIYLENPDRAEPLATSKCETLEYPVPPGRDAYTDARERGRIMLVVHLGGRNPTIDELVRTNVPGTILLPGEKVVGPALAPPCLPLVPKPHFDPKFGQQPFDEECLHDGGDRFTPAGIDPLGQLGGVDPEDTVAEYRDSSGRKSVVHSNRVCLCTPRYVALRKECPLAFSDAVVGPHDKTQVKRGIIIEEKTPSLMTTQTKTPRGLDGRLRPSINLNVEGPGLFTALKVLKAEQLDLGPIEYIGTKKFGLLTDKQKAEVVKQLKLVRELSLVKSLQGVEQITHTSVVARYKDGPQVVSTSLAVREINVCCNEAPIPPDRPLVLFKCADRGCANPGDIVTFTLRYSNVGGRPMTDVAVTDSLSGRLEYVPGSAVSDRDAVFTSQPNEAGSQLLRWEISGNLQPGETGRIKFQARGR